MEEFLKIAKRMLDRGIFQQMERLKSCLIAPHGNQMSNFLHLSRAWDLQRRNGERLTDFAGRLESTIREAVIHTKNKDSKDMAKGMTVDTVFSLVGAMLMSEKVLTRTPNIYPRLVKTMDNHYSASGIASEALNYLDRGINTDVTTDHDITAYYNKPQRPKPLKDPPGQRTTFKKYNIPTNHMSTPEQTRRDRTQDQEICRNYARGLSCFHGHNSPYRHPPHAQAHVATTEQNIPTGSTSSQINDPDFPYGADEMWWLVYRFSTPTITCLIFNNAPHNNPRSSELHSISKEWLSWTQRCQTRNARLASYPSLACQKMLGNAWHVPIPSWKE